MTPISPTPINAGKSSNNLDRRWIEGGPQSAQKMEEIEQQSAQKMKEIEQQSGQ
jgi:hypothetical protein